MVNFIVENEKPMNSTKGKAIFALIVGFSMLTLWCMLYATGQIAELATEPVRIGFHLVSEIATALLLVVSGIALILKKSRAKEIYLLSSGALMYSVLNAAGYYGQQHNTAVVWMFAIIFILAIATHLPLKRGYSKK